ncbi:MAG: hypothetical protein ACLQM6_06895 [Acidobacteriaceae bacterium]
MHIARQLDELPAATLRCIFRRSKISWWQPLLLLVAFGHTAYAVTAQVSACGTLDSDTRMQQDFIQSPMNQVEPRLPFGIDQGILPVTIALRLLVDRTGKVVQACTLYASQPATHSLQLLEEAATAAVMQRKYPKDFGHRGKGELHFSYKYLAGTTIFRFVPPAAKAK